MADIIGAIIVSILGFLVLVPEFVYVIYSIPLVPPICFLFNSCAMP